MNDHDLSAGLRTIHRERAVLPGAPSIHQRVRGIQFDDIPQQRRWLPLLPRFQSMFNATKFVVAAVVVALFGGFLLAGVLTQPRGESVPAAGAPASASPAASTAAQLVATDDALWDGRRNRGTERIDAATGEVTVIPTPAETALLLPTDDAIWVLGSVGVYRVDRAGLSVTDSIDVAGGPAVIADGSLWLWSLGTDDSSLVEIDLETRAIAGEYPMDGDSPMGKSAWAWPLPTYDHWIGTTDDAVWMHASTDAEHLLMGFDLQKREFTDPISIDEPGDSGYPWSCCIAVDDAIWLPGPREAGMLRRFDVATLEVTDTLELGPGLGGGIAAAGAIWMNGGGTIHRIDPVTMEVTNIPVTNYRNRPPAHGDGAVWVGKPSGLTRIDVDSLEVTTICRADCGMQYPPIVSNGVAWTFRDGGPTIRFDAVTGVRMWRQ